MISQRIRGLNSFFLVVQFCLVVVAYWVTLLFVVVLSDPMPDVRRYEIYCVVICLALLVEALRRLHQYPSFFQKSWLTDHLHALRQTLFTAFVVVLFIVFTKDTGISRRFLLVFLSVLYLTLFASRRLLPRLLAHWSFRGVRQERTLLVGPRERVRSLASWLDHKAKFGILTIGVLSDDEESREIGDIPRLGRPESLEQMVREHDVTQVILVELPNSAGAIPTMTGICERLGVRLLVLSDLETRFRRPITYFEDDGLMFIGLRKELLENPFKRFMKRAVDVSVSLPVILFLLPFTTLVVWCCQRRQSPGPLFYWQERAGHQRRRFRILKYRTMHPNTQNQAQQATAGDVRIFPTGRYLRKYSIDELPQFWNVLRGEMSVVGPRPHLLEHDQEFASIMSNYNIRAFIKPGITGLAQVRGFRGETKNAGDLVKRIELDIYYLENWSLSMDLMIICQTAWQVVFPPKSAV